MKQSTTNTVVSLVREIMNEFARLTGLSPAEAAPQRYLWTDALAVCNFLELYCHMNDEHYKHLAVLLVDQVHAILGRHCADDQRTGWISGLDEQEGAKHPAIGGLRIGRELNERRPEEPFDEHLEWERDGQYYHYLTQWMHALNRISRITGDANYNRWALELAKTAHDRFTYTTSDGRERRMYWKMSIDLSYPLVPSMGHHDPLDGLITYSELQAAARKYSEQSDLPDISAEIADLAEMCEGKSWTTDDPLGIGGLLIGVYKMAQLIAADDFAQSDLLAVKLENVLDDSLAGLEYYARTAPLKLPAEYRLAFRELGLSIGLHAVERMQGLIEQNRDVFNKKLPLHACLERLKRYTPLNEAIETFWLERTNRESSSWMTHRNINMVMLATSLAPDGYLSVY
ncbi:MAG: hypothetical protein ACOYW7_05430 [Nitrospirota bacterium]